MTKTPGPPRVRHRVLHKGADTNLRGLANACADEEKDGMALIAVLDAGALLVAVFMGAEVLTKKNGDADG